MKYPVEVTELSQRIVEVEADSRAEAERIAEEMWNQEEIVLDSNDFKGASFNAEEVPGRDIFYLRCPYIQRNIPKSVRGTDEKI